MAAYEITTANSWLEFDLASGGNNSCQQIDANHFIDFFQGASGDAFAQVITVDTTTWAVTTSAASLEFDLSDLTWASSCKMDDNHFLCNYVGYLGKWMISSFEVDTSTWAITEKATLEIDANGYGPSCAKIDDNHAISFSGASASDGYVQVLTVNTTTWEITTSTAMLEFDTVNGNYNSCFQIDSAHYINFWSGNGDDGYVQVFTVGDKTYTLGSYAETNQDTGLAVATAASGNYTHRAQSFQNVSARTLDSCQFYLKKAGSPTGNAYAELYAHTGTFGTSSKPTGAALATSGAFDISTLTTDYQLITFSFTGANRIALSASTYYCLAIKSDNGDGTNNVVVGTDNSSPSHAGNRSAYPDGGGWTAFSGYDTIFYIYGIQSYEVSTSAASLEFDTQNNAWNSCYQIDSNHFINFWSGVDSDGYAQVFTVNTSTWEVTTAAAWLEFDTQQNTCNSCYQLDSNHFVNVWAGVDTDAGTAYDGFMQVFTVNTSTWEVTTAAASLEFDTTQGEENSCFKVDTNHFINFWSGTADDGYVQVFTVEMPPADTKSIKDIIGGGFVIFPR